MTIFFFISFQIPISYPCLYGLDDCNGNRKIYTITLTSISMNSTLSSKYFKCSRTTCSLSSLTYTVSVVPGNFLSSNVLDHSDISSNK